MNVKTSTKSWAAGAVAVALAGGMAVVNLSNPADETCAPKMTVEDCKRVDKSYGKVVYVDADTQRFASVEPGAGDPPVVYIDPPSLRPLHSQCGLKFNQNRWLAVCPDAMELHRYWQWCGPPPLIPCDRQHALDEMFGWRCREGIDGVAGFQGSWRAMKKP